MNSLVKRTITIDELNKEFCSLTGVRRATCFIKNLDTDEIRFYQHKSGKYKIPKGWTNYKVGDFKKPLYPDFTDPINFERLLNIQWKIFGSLGPQYTRLGEESFPTNYLFTKVEAIKLCRSLGGGEMLEEYLKEVKNTYFDFIIPPEEVVNVVS